MIFKRIKPPLLRLLRAPTEPPEPPIGSPESVQTFRAAPNFLTYQIITWGLGFAVGLISEVVFVVVQHTNESGSWKEVTLGYAVFGITLLITVVKYFLLRLDYDMRTGEGLVLPHGTTDAEVVAVYHLAVHLHLLAFGADVGDPVLIKIVQVLEFI